MGKLHNKALWHRRARYQLQHEPLCAMCLAEGKVVAARIADHIEPHKGDPVKFWNSKLQSLCAHCHESRKKRLEHCGYDNTIGIDGMPIDPRHPVYRTL
jgi:5-methylcytosine-specific restriction enzyme A